MSATVPKIRVTDPQSSISRPFSASPGTASPESPVFQRQALGAFHGDAEPVSDSNSGRTSPASHGVTREGNGTASRHHIRQESSGKRPETSQSIVDPLSQFIAERTHQPTLLPTKSRQTVDEQSDAVSPQRRSSPGETRKSSEHGRTESKDNKKNRVSFLSRFMNNKKKDVASETPDKESDDQEEDRVEGAEASVFGEPYDNVSFNPRHPQPPRYIKVRVYNKREREFNKVFLAQELGSDKPGTAVSNRSSAANRRREKTIQELDGKAVWAMQFSTDGRYLATTGQDKLIKIWAVISSPEQRRAHEREEEVSADPADENFRLSAPVFSSQPIRVLEGHEGPILDLSWSKNNFLLSSSMDKTVRLWHISRSECLCAFKHTDYVTSIKFHPKDDRFFLAGSLDCKLRLWSIPDKSVAFWNQTADIITAVAFTPDGKSCIAGCLNGLCIFYETEGLKYQTQMHVRSARGRNAKGSKITGIKAVAFQPKGDLKLLVSSNDSRIRLYNYRDKSLEVKFKGNENTSSQIHATFSDDGRYVICGSEDKKVYIWSMQTSLSDQKDRRPVEVFEAHSGVTTVSLLAPTKTKRLLSASEDPIYDLCNPPPVTLISRAEERPPSAPSSVKGTSDVGSIQPTPTHYEGSFIRAEESPAYRTRAAHTNGNIIVTADSTGAIKVFRQDCAAEKRLGDTASLSSRVKAGIVRRQSSITSARSRHSVTGQARDRRDSRILSWRQGVASNGSLAESKSMSSSLLQEALSRTRSSSPRKSQSFPSKRPSASPSLAGKDSPIDGPARSSEPGPFRMNHAATMPPPSLHTHQQTSHPRLSGLLPNRKRGSMPTKILSPASNPPAPITNELTASPTDLSPPSTHLRRPDPLSNPAFAPQKSQQYWEHEAWQADMLEQLHHHVDSNGSPANHFHASRPDASENDNPNGRRLSNGTAASKLSNEMDSSCEGARSASEAYEDAHEGPDRSSEASEGSEDSESGKSSRQPPRTVDGLACARCGGSSVRDIVAGGQDGEGARMACADCGLTVAS